MAAVRPGGPSAHGDADAERAVAGVGVQRGDAASAILAEGAVRLADVDAEPSNASAAAGGGSLFARDGKLFWKGSAGTVTQLAPA